MDEYNKLLAEAVKDDEPDGAYIAELHKHINEIKDEIAKVCFYFILFCFILFYFVLFYFILFYFILFYFILFYFILLFFIFNYIYI